MTPLDLAKLKATYENAVELATKLEADEVFAKYLEAKREKFRKERLVFMPLHQRVGLHDNALDKLFGQVRLLKWLVLTLVIINIIIPVILFSAAGFAFAVNFGESGIPGVAVEQKPQPTQTPPYDVTVENPNAFGWPFAPGSYVISQEPHDGVGAIDYALLPEHRGEPVMAVTNCVIMSKFIDGLGNTNLVCENQNYRVTHKHGDYSVEPGTEVKIGMPLGEQGNNGNTWSRDANSNPIYCGTGSSCGYHEHIEVFDKNLGVHVNPENLFAQQGGN